MDSIIIVSLRELVGQIIFLEEELRNPWDLST